MFNFPSSNGYTPWYGQSTQQQQSNISVVFIQGGETAADAYLVAPNQSVILIDNEAGKIFIKATDVSGMPIPQRKFNEEKRAPVQMQADFVTREEFEKRLAELKNVPTAQQQ